MREGVWEFRDGVAYLRPPGFRGAFEVDEQGVLYWRTDGRPERPQWGLVEAVEWENYGGVYFLTLRGDFVMEPDGMVPTDQVAALRAAEERWALAAEALRAGEAGQFENGRGVYRPVDARGVVEVDRSGDVYWVAPDGRWRARAGKASPVVEKFRLFAKPHRTVSAVFVPREGWVFPAALVGWFREASVRWAKNMDETGLGKKP